MASEKPLRRIVFRWTALKGLTAIALFFILALLIEYIIVYLFLSSGLVDEFSMSQVLRILGTSFSFTITISPVFHLIPLGVIIVLISSWTYVTRHVAVLPRRIPTSGKAQEARRKQYARPGKVRFKSIRQLSKKLNKRLRRFSRRVGAALRRVRVIFYVSQRLSFAKATVKSALTVLAIFLTSVFALSLLSYPSLIHERVISLYGSNPSFLGFVLETIELAQAVGRTLSPLGWALSSVDKALHAAAPGFRSALEGFGTVISAPLARLDLLWKYVICQNVAAWISAVLASVYAQYASRLRRHYKK